MVGSAAVLTACGDDSQRQREQERTEQRNKELALMSNMTLAGPEIERLPFAKCKRHWFSSVLLERYQKNRSVRWRQEVSARLRRTR